MSLPFKQSLIHPFPLCIGGGGQALMCICLYLNFSLKYVPTSDFIHLEQDETLLMKDRLDNEKRY